MVLQALSLCTDIEPWGVKLLQAAERSKAVSKQVTVRPVDIMQVSRAFNTLPVPA
jgi:hypothetical protein